jgi:hypothetical protein
VILICKVWGIFGAAAAGLDAIVGGGRKVMANSSIAGELLGYFSGDSEKVFEQVIFARDALLLWLLFCY